MAKKVIKVICFSMLFLLVFVGFHNVFNFKYGDGIYSMTNFYKEPEDSIDVMCFGSSMVFENINTGILWDEYGIAGYNLCGSVQPLWNTYYYIKEALKTQSPKVLVVDVYGAIQTEDYIDHSRIIKNNYGLNFSKDKIDSIKVSSPEDAWPEYLLEYPTYHNRYKEISRADFVGHLGLANYEYWKGFGLNTSTASFEKPVGFNTKLTTKLTDKAEKYLLKIIELTKENNIPLLLVKTPYIITDDDQRRYNEVERIADENNIPFINFNFLYDEIGIDFSIDYADENHLNHLGNVKFTRYLAAYLKENYEIPDRRGNSDYESYYLMAEDYKQRIYNFEITKINDIGSYIDKAQNKNFTTVYSLSGDYKNMENYAAVKNKLMTIGINPDENEGDSVWIIKDGKVLYTGSNEKDFVWHTALGEDNNLMVTANTKTGGGIEVNLNNTIYKEVPSGLNIVIYDNCTESLVESSGFLLYEHQLAYSKTVG